LKLLKEKFSMRPDLILFLSDDHGAWALGCYGNREIQSPRIDDLARGGGLFERAFCVTPVCSPARASLFTGLIASQHGIHDYLLEEPGTDGPSVAGMPLLSEKMRAAGYQTGYFGKWHCGQSWDPAPGFDRWFTPWPDARGTRHSNQVGWSEQGKRVEIHGQSFTDIVTERAMNFLRSARREAPIFLVVAPLATHAPFRDHEERFVAPCRKFDFSDIPCETHADPRVRIEHAPDPANERERLAQYYGAVAEIDEAVGRVLDAHKTTGRNQSRVVCYTSDHGHMNGHHGCYTKGNATIPQNFFEESIRVPLILHAPGLFGAQRLSGLVDHCDLHATLLELADAGPAPDGSPGRGFLSTLRFGAPWAKKLQFCEYGNARMVRSTRWKLILRYPPHAPEFGDELYDLETDPRERINRITHLDCQAIVADLREEAARFFARYSTPENDGRDVLRFSAYNPREPWRAPTDHS